MTAPAAPRHVRPGRLARLLHREDEGLLPEAQHPDRRPAGRAGQPPKAERERHRIDTSETLTALIAQAEAEARTGSRAAAQALTEPWDKPEDLYPSEQDVRSPRSRAYIPQPDAPVRWYAPLSPQESADRMRRIKYPPPGASPRQYAAVMGQVSAATGTTSRWERPALWPRDAIEAGREIAP